MSETQTNKQVIQELIQAVWINRELAALPTFWTEDCINHAMPEPGNHGLDALRAYHEQFFAAFAAFSDIRIEVVQQVAEADRVVSHMMMTARHTGLFLGVPATHKNVSQAAIRIDRFRGGKIAEHWSVSDMAGLMQQLQA